MEVLLDTTYNPQGFDEAHIRDLAQFVCAKLNLPANCEVSITFVDNDEIAELNEQYRGKTGPTDVLSFECDNLVDNFSEIKTPAGDWSIEFGAYELGDIIIAPDVVASQAEGYGNTQLAELELMVVHGLLHLCGYDHIKDEEAEQMEALQQELLQAWADLK